MPTQYPQNVFSIPWPDIATSYVDEYGQIDPAVYELVPKVWPLVVPYILRTIGELSDGQPLMFKAVALVSRKVREEPGKITSVHGYLFKTFIHLLYEEYTKHNKHEELDRDRADRSATLDRSDKEIYESILIHELMEHADKRTREVFQLEMLGYSLEEIARKLGMGSNYLRSQWHKDIKRLAKKIRKETIAAEMKVLRRRVRLD